MTYPNPKINIELNNIKYTSNGIISRKDDYIILLFQQNNNKNNIILGKLYVKQINDKDIIYEKLNIDKLNKQQLKLLNDNNIILKYLFTKNINDTIKINLPYYEDMTVEYEFKNYIEFYEIGYFCSLYEYLKCSKYIFNFNNYKDIINIINSTIKSLDILTNKCKIILYNISIHNILINNNYNNDLLILFNKKNKIFDKYNNDKSRNIFNTKLKKNLELIKNILKKKDINYNIKITDINFFYDLNNITKLLNNKNKDINECLLYLFKYYNLYHFVNSFYYNISSELLETQDKTIINNCNKIIDYLTNIKKYLINTIISKCMYIKSLNINNTKIILDNFIHIILSIDNINQTTINNIYNFMIKKEFIKDEYIYFNNETKLFSNSVVYNNKLIV